MYCVKCNSKIEYHMKKCKKCGRKTTFEDFLFMDKKINPSYSNSEMPENEEPNIVETQQISEKKMGKSICILLSCVLVAILAAGNVVLLNAKPNKTDSKQISAESSTGTIKESEEDKKYVVNGLRDDIVATDEKSVRYIVKSIGGMYGWKADDAEKVIITEEKFENNKFYRCSNGSSAIIIAADVDGKVFYIADGKSGKSKNKDEAEEKDDNSILTITGLDKNDDIYKAYEVILDGAEHEVKSKLIDLSEKMNESELDKEKIRKVWEMSLRMISDGFEEEQCLYAVTAASEKILGDEHRKVEVLIRNLNVDLPEECKIVDTTCDFTWLSKSQKPLPEKNYITTKTDEKGEKVEKLSNNEFYTIKIARKSEKSEKEVHVYVSDIGVSKVVTKTDFDDEEEIESDKDKEQMPEKNDGESEINEKPGNDGANPEKPSDFVEEFTNEIL